MNALKAFLIEKFGLPADADEAAVKKLAAEKLTSGELPHEKYLELITPKATEPSAIDRLADALAKRFGLNAPAVETVSAVAPTAKEVELGIGTHRPLADSAVQPASMFAAAARAAGSVNIKRASESYDGGMARKSYPTDAKYKLHAPSLAGRDVTFEGRAVYEPSDKQKAMSGAWLAYKAWQVSGHPHPLAQLTDHHKDLVRELVESAEWVGEYRDQYGKQVWTSPRKLSALQQKTYLDDSTSGGANLVPYFFDVDLVTYPLLHGELFPFVDLRDLDISNQVKTPTLANLTTSAGPAEGDSPGITLQTTTALSTAITSNVYNFTGALTVGRDMLSDTPIQLLAAFQELYNQSLLQFLDKAIAIGDGTTYILGIVNTTSTQTFSAKNSTTGPYVVGDIEGMVKSLPKQYRGPKDKVCWVAADGSYFRIRGIAVSTSDARRIFGYDYDAYVLASRPFKVENDIAGSTLAYGRMDKFRMWRRKGLQLETSTDGKTLMVANEMVLVARSRWAGQVIDPNSWVLMTNAPLH